MDEHLKDRLAFMGTLASGLAHEIKSPLSTMTITLGLLREDLEDLGSAVDGRTLRKVQLLEGEVGRLEHILRDFLQFAGGHAVHPELIDVQGWLSELLDFVEPRCTEAGVRLVRQTTGDLPAVVVDRELMKQATLHLLNNALEAMPEGGTLTVRAWSPGDRVHIDVSDTGAGVPPHLREEIFGVWFSTKDSGSGLGLPTVRRILAEHAGEVVCTPLAEGGTRFSLILPRPVTLHGVEPLRLPGAPAGEDDVVHVLGDRSGDASESSS